MVGGEKIVYVEEESNLFKSIFYDPMKRELLFLLQINEAYKLKNIEYAQFIEFCESEFLDGYFEEHFKDQEFENINPKYLITD